MADIIKTNETTFGECYDLPPPGYTMKNPKALGINFINVAFYGKGIEQESLLSEIDYRIVRNNPCPAIAQIEFAKAQRLKYIDHCLVQDLHDGFIAQMTPRAKVSRLDRNLVRELIVRLLM